MTLQFFLMQAFFHMNFTFPENKSGIYLDLHDFIQIYIASKCKSCTLTLIWFYMVQNQLTQFYTYTLEARYLQWHKCELKVLHLHEV
jgi:hypothetical protein